MASSVSAANMLSYRLIISVDVIAAVLTVGLIFFLRRQRTRAYLGKSALGSLVILPIYEPVLWALVLAYVVQSLLLMVPGPVTQVPVWFTRAIYRESSSVQLGPDSGAFWLYNVVSETMAEGFGIMLLHKFPSPEAFGSTLRYAVLYAAVASSVATLGYNWEGLGLEETTQDATDVAFLAVPCALYAALLVQFSALSARRSLGVYAVFCVAWRGALLCALLLADRSSPATAVVSMIRNLATPFVMYYTLVRDTDYWNGGGWDADDDEDASNAAPLELSAISGREDLGASEAAATPVGSGGRSKAWGGLSWSWLRPSSGEAGAPLLESSSAAAPGASAQGGPLERPPTAAKTATYGSAAAVPAPAPVGGGVFTPTSPTATWVDWLLLGSSSGGTSGAGTPPGAAGGRSSAGGSGSATGSASGVSSPALPGTPSKAGGGAAAAGGPPRPRKGSQSRRWLIPHSEVHDTFRPLGEGGAAQVTLGVWRGREVALKKSRPEDLHKRSAVEAMVRESAFYRLVSACPQVIRFYGLVRSPPHVYMVLELCRGGSLYGALGKDIDRMVESGDYQDSNRTLSWETKLRLAWDVATALAFLHGLGYAHMDVKTANVLLKPPEDDTESGDGASALPRRPSARSSAVSIDSMGGDPIGSGSGSFSSSGAGVRSSTTRRRPRWRAVLADFGEYVDVRNPHEPLAHRLEKQRGGTPHYKSPELLLPRSFFDAKADVYALGMLIYELMTYRYPYWEIQSSMRGGDAVFEGWLRQAIPRGVRPLDESDAMWQDEAPPRLEALMCRCWATDPHARPTAAEAAAELASIADDWVALLAAEGSAEAEGRLSFH